MIKKRDIGQEILDGIRDLKAGKVGKVVNVPAVAEIREKMGLSQSRFATLLGVSVRTLQDWEQGRRTPSRRSPNTAARCGKKSAGGTRGGLSTSHKET